MLHKQQRQAKVEAAQGLQDLQHQALRQPPEAREEREQDEDGDESDENSEQTRDEDEEPKDDDDDDRIEAGEKEEEPVQKEEESREGEGRQQEGEDDDGDEYIDQLAAFGYCGDNDDESDASEEVEGLQKRGGAQQRPPQQYRIQPGQEVEEEQQLSIVTSRSSAVRGEAEPPVGSDRLEMRVSR